MLANIIMFTKRLLLYIERILNYILINTDKLLNYIAKNKILQ